MRTGEEGKKASVFERDWPRKETSLKELHSASKSWWEYQWRVCLWRCLVRVWMQTSWIKSLQFLSHTGVSRVLGDSHVLMNWRIALTEQSLDGFIEIFKTFLLLFFFLLWCENGSQQNWILTATGAVTTVERLHEKIFVVEHLTSPWYYLLSANLLHGNDCTLLMFFFVFFPKKNPATLHILFYFLFLKSSIFQG